MQHKIKRSSPDELAQSVTDNTKMVTGSSFDNLTPNTKEISDLISIREYAHNSVENMSILKSDSNQLRNMISIIDKKLVSMILSPEFKDYLEIEV